MTKFDVRVTKGLEVHGKLTVGFDTSLARSYYGAAARLAKGIRPLVDAVPTVGCVDALAFLCGQVVESALSAYLTKESDSDERLRKPPLMHNLKLHWELAHAERLDLPMPPPDWLLSLDSLHGKPYRLRYAKGETFLFRPGPEPMSTEVEALLTMVEQALTPKG